MNEITIPCDVFSYDDEMLQQNALPMITFRIRWTQSIMIELNSINIHDEIQRYNRHVINLTDTIFYKKFHFRNWNSRKQHYNLTQSCISSVFYFFVWIKKGIVDFVPVGYLSSVKICLFITYRNEIYSYKIILNKSNVRIWLNFYFGKFLSI